MHGLKILGVMTSLFDGIICGLMMLGHHIYVLVEDAWSDDVTV